MAKSPKKAKKNKIGRAIFRILLLAVAAVIAGVGLFSWNAARVAGNALPMPFGYGVAVVLSGSMEPELSVDDLVIIREAEEFQEGDVVVYQSGSSLVIHRIIQLEGETAITQGDANNAPDDPVPLTAIKGKLLVAIPFVGVVTHIVQNPVGVICILALAVLFLEFSYQKEKKSDETDLEKIKEEIRVLRAETRLHTDLDVTMEDLERMEQEYKNEMKE